MVQDEAAVSHKCKKLNCKVYEHIKNHEKSPSLATSAYFGLISIVISLPSPGNSLG
jgi:hypothetical protein